MKLKSRLINCGIALSLVSSAAVAQGDADAPDENASKMQWTENLYFGLGAGTNFAFTNVKQYLWYPVSKFVSEYGLGIEGTTGYTVSPVWSLEGNIQYATHRGTDRPKGVYFRANSLDFSLGAKINLSNLVFSDARGQRKWSLYTDFGMGFNVYQSALYELSSGDHKEDAVLGFDGYENSDLDGGRAQTGTLYGGIGLMYRYNNKLNFFAETSARWMDTDKLDSWVSNGGINDRYVSNTVGAIYRLGNKSWQRPEERIVDQVAKLDSIIDGFKDSDGDGVMDNYDKDNKTPEGAKSYGDGTAVDTDGDGVFDVVDQERLSVCTEVDENGVALDNDGDGVPNCKDKEPNSAKDCQVDIAGRCIKTGPVAAPTSDGGSAVSSGLPSVFFELNSSTVDYRNYPALTQVAQFLKANPKVNLVVVGHTDQSGPKDYNDKLAKQRAEAIINHLVKIYGIDKSRLKAEAKGSAEPLAKGGNGKANRRVDFLIGG
jgi:outer membrane protein OmpA-like peptidoglycan-associated protein